MAKMPKVHTLFSDRTNSSDRRFRELKTGTLEELCEYYGVTAKTISSLCSKVNKEYADRYACCYRLSHHISVATPEQIVEFAEKKVD
jgi:hypothetical protein